MQRFVHALPLQCCRRVGIAAIATMFLVAAPAALAAFPGRNGKIAIATRFSCGPESNAIAAVNADGTGLRMLSECGSISSSPTWSPDGDSLLYSAVTPAVFRMAADGSNRRRISRGSAPSFAPDGRHFAYVRNRPGPGTAIRRARLDGTHDRSLGVGDMPRWSPAGRKLAYYRHGVWIMSSRTGKQPRLVATRDFMPLDWSPDGQRLLCASFDPRNARADLYVVRVDGSRPPRQLTRTADRSEEQAAWSPNGRRIVVAATTSPKPFSLQYSILTMSRRGQDEQRIWSSRVFGDEDEDWAGSQPTVSWQPRPQ